MIQHQTDDHCLTINRLTVTPPHQRSPVLKDIDFSLRNGEIVMLGGQSGSGKTTLLKTLNGLIPWFDPYHVAGSVMLDGYPVDDLDPGQRSHLISTCLDRPENQLFLPSPIDEIEHACKRYGPAEPLHQPCCELKKNELIDAFGIRDLLNRRTSELSSGERQKVALVTTMLAHNRPILLDEPSAHLDSHSVQSLVSTCAHMAKQGSSFLISEHASWRWKDVASSYVKIQDAYLLNHGTRERPQLTKPKHTAGSKIALSTKDLCVGRHGKTVLGPINLNLHEGEIVALTGHNGAGKSTLARTLSGWLKPINGLIKKEKNIRTDLMLSEAELQLFSRTVSGELAKQCQSTEELARVLRRHRVEHLAARPPWQLSRGEQQRLVHATYDLQKPGVLIIDEPAQGLGTEDLETLVKLIQRRAEKGRSYLLITHRQDLALSAHRHLHLEQGQLREVTP